MTKEQIQKNKIEKAKRIASRCREIDARMAQWVKVARSKEHEIVEL